ncbi:MAG TPA: MATE family efflux transporter [Phnomibacter sp.]|nr:MATE family efflux transporter [Phnomibacter sp.]
MLVKEFKKTLWLAIPLIISNIAQVGHGLIDSAMVGSIDYKQLAASSLVINAVAIPQVICIGLTIAITAMVSISRGQKNETAASNYLYNGFVLNTLASIAIALLCTFSTPLLYHLGQDPDIIPIAQPYFVIMAWALVPMTMFLSIKQFSDALEFTRTGMMLALFSLVLNAFFCWLLVFGNWGFPRMELLGAGLATFISRFLVAIVMAIIVYKHHAYKAYMRVRAQAWKLSRKTWKELLHIGIPSGLQLSMETGAFSLSGIMVGWLGATVQAAHQIALNCATATFMAIVGLSMGASIRTSHAYGSKQMHRLSLIGRSTMWGGLLYGASTGLFYVLFRHQLPLLFNTDPAVVAMAAQLLLVAAIFQVSDSLQAIGAGVCRGIKDMKVPTILVTIAYWGIGIPAGYWLAFVKGFGAAGIWWGFVFGLSMAAIFLNKRFLKMVTRLEKNS